MGTVEVDSAKEYDWSIAATGLARGQKVYLRPRRKVDKHLPLRLILFPFRHPAVSPVGTDCLTDVASKQVSFGMPGAVTVQ